MNKKIRNSIIVASLFLVLAIPIIAETAFANPNGLPAQSKADVIAVMGTGHVQGEPVIVEILVEVQPGENTHQVTRDVLKAHNLKPFSSSGLGTGGFEVTGFYWPSHGLTQLYNIANQEGDTASILTETHSDWNGVNTSDFTFSSGGESSECPSMVRECPGPQVFDGENTVGWLNIKSRGTLAIAYFATSSQTGPETDIALNTKYSWKNACDGDNDNIIDVETVLRHENGHAAGIGHSQDSTALMAAFYSGPNCLLDHDDDNEAITYLYDNDVLGTVSGTVTNSIDGAPIAGAIVELDGTTYNAMTDDNGDYVIPGVPDPVTYTVTASKSGFENSSIDRLKVGGAITSVDFILSDGGGENPTPTNLTIADITSGPLDNTQGKEGGVPYSNRDTVHILIQVNDANNNGVVGIPVHLTIDAPKSNLSGDSTTGAGGIAHIHYKVNAGRDGSGTYHIYAEIDGDSCILESDICHADFNVN